jgi:hypothetical protein
MPIMCVKTSIDCICIQWLEQLDLNQYNIEKRGFLSD